MTPDEAERLRQRIIEDIAGVFGEPEESTPDPHQREIIRGMAKAMGVHPIFCKACCAPVLYATQKIPAGAAGGTWGHWLHWWDNGEQPNLNDKAICPQCDARLGMGLRRCGLSEVFA